MSRRKRLMFFVTEDWYFCSHRLALANAANKAGFDVTVVTRVRSHGEIIKDAGLKLIPLEISRRGVNPFSEIRTIGSLYSIYKAVQPDIVHHVAIKPVIYGSIAARLAGIQHVVNALAGLGFLFSSSSLKSKIIRWIIKIAFRMLLNRSDSRVILQNPDDVRLMHVGRVINGERITLIRGSGVNTQEFMFHEEPPGQPIVILASRMLWDKGVGEYITAARQLIQRNTKARFVLVGDGDIENPLSIPNDQLKTWHAEGIIEWWGRKDNMPEVFAQTHIVCLPSFYGEGVPKVLIEAASCGRPIVTTDAPGCREIVHDHINGFLVPVKDSVAIANALNKLIESADLRKQMGEQGRKLVVKEFSLDIVNRKTLAVYQEMLQ